MSQRDEDISFPPSISISHTGDIKSILNDLERQISVNENDKEIKCCLEMMRGLLLVVVNTFDS